MKLLVDVLKLELGKLKFIILFCKELYFLVDIFWIWRYGGWIQ